MDIFPLLRLLALPRLPAPLVRANLRHNAALPPPAAPAPMGQTTAGLAAYRYGAVSCRHAGCGVLACYNALALLGKPVPLPALINTLESAGGQVLFAALGTLPQALVAALRQYGVAAQPLAAAAAANTLARSTPGAVLLLTLWNRRGQPLSGMHTIAVQAVPCGLLAYNRFGADQAPRLFSDMQALLAGGGYICGWQLTNMPPAPAAYSHI